MSQLGNFNSSNPSNPSNPHLSNPSNPHLSNPSNPSNPSILSAVTIAKIGEYLLELQVTREQKLLEQSGKMDLVKSVSEEFKKCEEILKDSTTNILWIYYIFESDVSDETYECLYGKFTYHMSIIESYKKIVSRYVDVVKSYAEATIVTECICSTYLETIGIYAKGIYHLNCDVQKRMKVEGYNSNLVEEQKYFSTLLFNADEIRQSVIDDVTNAKINVTNANADFVNAVEIGEIVMSTIKLSEENINLILSWAKQKMQEMKQQQK